MRRLRAILTLIFLSSFANLAGAANLTLSWDAPTTWEDGTVMTAEDRAAMVYVPATGPSGSGPWSDQPPTNTGALSSIVPSPPQGSTLWYTVKARFTGSPDSSYSPQAVSYAAPLIDNQATVQLSGTDTYTNSGSPSAINAASAELRAYTWPAGKVANRIHVNVSLLPLPTGATILSAKWFMYLTGFDGGGGSNPMRISVSRVTGSPPDLSTLSWSTFAAPLAPAESSADVGLSPGWNEWTVTEAAKFAQANGGVLSLALDGGTVGATDTNRTFASSEHGTPSLRPYLLVTYAMGQGEPKTLSFPADLKAE
jgi:hypothetical protein